MVNWERHLQELWAQGRDNECLMQVGDRRPLISLVCGEGTGRQWGGSGR